MIWVVLVAFAAGWFGRPLVHRMQAQAAVERAEERRRQDHARWPHPIAAAPSNIRIIREGDDRG